MLGLSQGQPKIFDRQRSGHSWRAIMILDDFAASPLPLSCRNNTGAVATVTSAGTGLPNPLTNAIHIVNSVEKSVVATNGA